ncbi:MAG: hypothetical protein FWG33_02020 [Oscillospiraceae bacterium]|nr:hypothetical protein [Oscillospiraceae bacterium]
MTKSKFPLVALFFGIAFIVCTIIRYLQYASVIRIDNGFFEHNGGFSNNAYYLFFAIFAAGAVLLAFADKKAGRGVLSGGLSEKPLRYKFSTQTAVIGIILFTFCGGFIFLNTVMVFTAGNNETSIPMKIAMCAAVLGFTYAGYTIVTQKEITPPIAIPFLFIAAYNIGMAVGEFMQRIYTVHLSARLVELSVSVLLAVFFLSCGRIIVRSEARFTSVLATVAGYSVILLILSDGLSRIFFYYGTSIETQKFLTNSNNGFLLPSPLFFTQGIAVLWLIFALSARQINLNNKEDEEIEKSENENTDDSDDYSTPDNQS